MFSGKKYNRKMLRFSKTQLQVVENERLKEHASLQWKSAAENGIADIQRILNMICVLTNHGELRM